LGVDRRLTDANSRALKATRMKPFLVAQVIRNGSPLNSSGPKIDSVRYDESNKRVGSANFYRDRKSEKRFKDRQRAEQKAAYEATKN